MLLLVSVHAELRAAVRTALAVFYTDAPEETNEALVYPVPADVDQVTRAALTAGAHDVIVSASATPAPVAVSYPTFSARFAHGEPQERVDTGMAFARALSAHQGVFAEPPTGWEEDVWCVYGAHPDLHVVATCARAHGGHVISADGVLVNETAEAAVGALVSETAEAAVDVEAEVADVATCASAEATEATEAIEVAEANVDKKKRRRRR